MESKMAVYWSRRSYTKEDLVCAVESAKSYAHVARILGMNADATAYKSIKPAVIELGLDTSHFTGRAWNAGGEFVPRKAKPVEEYLVNGSRISSSRLKSRLIKEGLLEPKCSAPFCPVPNPTVNPFTGEEAELKLSLDHINGDNTDNRIENLRLLCYHCHGMTDTWCRGQSKPKVTTLDCVECFKPIAKHLYVHKQCIRCIRCQNFTGGRKNLCRQCGAIPKKIRSNEKFRCDCGSSVTVKGLDCLPCSRVKSRKIDWPRLEDLVTRLMNSNYSRLAGELGVSDNAIRKHLLSYGVDPKSLSSEIIR